MTHASALSRRAWLVVGILWFVGCSLYFTRFMLITMHGSIVSAIPMTETKFGLLISVFLWVYALANPVGGFLADRFGRSRVILVSMFAWSTLTWLTIFVTSFPQLLALRALMGVSQACYLPAALRADCRLPPGKYALIRKRPAYVGGDFWRRDRRPGRLDGGTAWLGLRFQYRRLDRESPIPCCSC